MDATELRRVFNQFDQNNDERVSTDELTHFLANMGAGDIPDKDMAQILARVDSDGDGCVDFDEFQNLYRLIMEEREREGGEEEADIKEAFNVFDKNGDGFISPEELQSVLAALGFRRGGKSNEDDCRLMIRKVDVDGDGLVSFVEFKKMMMQGHTLINPAHLAKCN